MAEIRLLAHVRGCVQGVGFRYSTSLKARELGIHGWVRNRPDGSVESYICGDGMQIKAMQDWLGHGPTGAHVESVTYSPLELTEPINDFSVRV